MAEDWRTKEGGSFIVRTLAGKDKGRRKESGKIIYRTTFPTFKETRTSLRRKTFLLETYLSEGRDIQRDSYPGGSALRTEDIPEGSLSTS